LGAILVTVVSNAFLEWWLRQVGGQMKGGFFQVMLWDALILAFLLHWTGGLGNPFALFFLVQLTLAAVTLHGWAVAGLGVVIGACCIWLGWTFVPLLRRDGSPLPPELLRAGAFVAVTLAAGFIVTLLLGLREHSRRLQAERARLQTELASRDRFSAVEALAMGFAHELATPIGSIALAAEELAADPAGPGREVIAREVRRCREVLDRMRELGQDATAQTSSPCHTREVVDLALAELSPAQRGRVTLDFQAENTRVIGSGLPEALLVLMRNALMSSPGDSAVRLSVKIEGPNLRFTVVDAGPGFSEEMLRHWGEPFRGTRGAEGMGLGLYFVRRLAEASHGSLKVENVETGARVTLVLPRET